PSPSAPRWGLCVLCLARRCASLLLLAQWISFLARFGTHPCSTGHGHGDYGLLPLLWGTLMVSAIALLVAIPVGLMTAIYMAEYAPTKFRSFAKPVIEILAGIPTIV